MGNLNWAIIQQNVERIITVSEEEIKKAMKLIWERMKIVSIQYKTPKFINFKHCKEKILVSAETRAIEDHTLFFFAVLPIYLGLNS